MIGRLMVLPGLGSEGAGLVAQLDDAVDAGLAEMSWAVEALRPEGSGPDSTFRAHLGRSVANFADWFGVRAWSSCAVRACRSPHVRSQAELLRIVHEALTNVNDTRMPPWPRFGSWSALVR